jgi:peptidoglycan/xylan/chitin deacetylase (PgdA/CDA1 family)
LNASWSLQAKPREAPPVSVLMYHQVGEFPSPKAHRAGYCHVRRFRSQMRYLARFGYHVLGLEQALSALFGDVRLPARSVVLTFDDGYQNFREHAWPVLAEHHFPATVYLVSGRVGDRSRWLEKEGRDAAMMNASTVRELRAEGVLFGSHTVSHPRLSRLAAEQVRAEVEDSKAALEDLLGESVPHFCYPFGDYDAGVREAVQAAGYHSALTCIRGAANSADNVFEIPRKAISYGDNLVGYAWKLHMKHARK